MRTSVYLRRGIECNSKYLYHILADRRIDYINVSHYPNIGELFFNVLVGDGSLLNEIHRDFVLDLSSYEDIGQAEIEIRKAEYPLTVSLMPEVSYTAELYYLKFCVDAHREAIKYLELPSSSFSYHSIEYACACTSYICEVMLKCESYFKGSERLDSSLRDIVSLMMSDFYYSSKDMWTIIEDFNKVWELYEPYFKKGLQHVILNEYSSILSIWRVVKELGVTNFVSYFNDFYSNNHSIRKTTNDNLALRIKDDIIILKGSIPPNGIIYEPITNCYIVYKVGVYNVSAKRFCYTDGSFDYNVLSMTDSQFKRCCLLGDFTRLEKSYGLL